jgi:hypothetical protein
MQPAPKAFAEGRHLPAKHGKRQRCVRRASEMSSHRAACRRFLQPHSGTLTVSGNARMELHDEPCTDKMSSGHCPHSPERSHGHQSSCGSRGMRRRPLADMWGREGEVDLCQNRKISRMRAKISSSRMIPSELLDACTWGAAPSRLVSVSVRVSSWVPVFLTLTEPVPSAPLFKI